MKYQKHYCNTTTKGSEMTANELADKLEIAQGNNTAEELIPEAIAMLRQQQAEIEALKGRIDRLIENASHHEGIAHAGGFAQGHEVGRQLGMKQERALWNLSESTQEFESFDRTASHMAGEYVAHKELNDGGEPVKNATYWKRQYNLMATQNDNLKSGLYHANEQIKYLESHPVKDIIEKNKHEIEKTNAYIKSLEDEIAILRKAQEK